MGEMTTLVRTKQGAAAHLAACSYAGAFPVPWQWSEGRTRDEVEAVAAQHGIRMCKRCDPLGALPDRAEVAR